MLRLLIASLVGLLPLVVSAQTHYEQDDSHITYTGTWYPNSNSFESGGTATLTNFKGAQVILNFNGTGITWIGTADPYAGECYVNVDGVQTLVDTSIPTSPNTFYQHRLFEVHNLAPGIHHMNIEVLHVRDSTTSGSWVWVDGFDVDNGVLVNGPIAAGTGTFDQGSISANYTGHWFQNPGPNYSGGTVSGTVDPGSKVDFTFNGTAVSWIGFRDEYSGIAQVSIDGTGPTTVDTYLTPSKTQTVTWSSGNLTPGTHTLSIVATGTHSAASGGSWVYVDGFQVTGSALSGTPNIYNGGFVSAASFMAAPNNQVAPGQIVSIFGENFTAASSANATTIPLPTQLSPQNTSVTACGKSLPLYSVFPGQINAQIPLECPTSGVITATVSAAGYTNSAAFSAAPAAPGIFTVNASGSGDGVILHADNTLVTASNPAIAGETVVIYCTGLGPTSPSFATGTAANLANNTTLPVTVTMGGKSATVMYSGLTQSLVGLYQVNAVVPAGLTGSQEVIIKVNGTAASRSGVTMATK